MKFGRNSAGLNNLIIHESLQAAETFSGECFAVLLNGIGNIAEQGLCQFPPVESLLLIRNADPVFCAAKCRGKCLDGKLG